MTNVVKFIPGVINYKILPDNKICVSTCKHGIRRARIFSEGSELLLNFKDQLLKDGYREKRVNKFIDKVADTLGIKLGPKSIKEQPASMTEHINLEEPKTIIEAPKTSFDPKKPLTEESLRLH